MESILLQYGAICIFLLLMGFTFCDGFKLHTGLKLLWFAVFATIAIYNVKTHDRFVLEEILPAPCLLAFALGWYQLKIRGAKKKSS